MEEGKAVVSRAFLHSIEILTLIFCSSSPYAEAVKVDIEFKNPLQIPLLLSSVSLICELSENSDEMQSGNSLSLFPLKHHHYTNLSV